ncbi:zinc finger protein 615 [Astyanax mexicanus]|uniref:zinc finger protein 615 n=1 Tax=Astyanax mexicanus TaxID=7994 RepID=UPI0020CAAB71|nr:zinc finger protein 615 [Astyanax mexicanus]
MAETYFHVQLTAILDMLLKTAAVDICALADSVFSSLQREIERCTSENDELRRQLQSFLSEPNISEPIEAAPLKTREKNCRTEEDVAGKSHDSKQKTNNMETNTGAVKSSQRLQKRRAVSAGVKVEVTEMYVTNQCMQDSMDDDAEINDQLSDLSPELKTELKHNAASGSHLNWNDCSIKDFEEEEEENSLSLEGQEDIEDLNTHYVPYAQSSRDEEDEERDKDQLQHDPMSLPRTRDLQCSFIQIDGTVTAAVPHNNDRQAQCKSVCPICGKRVMSEKRLRVHIKTHSDLRPYTCFQCGKSFTRKATLNFHQNIHRGVKPYACNFCPKSFADPSALRRHKAIHKVMG